MTNPQTTQALQNTPSHPPTPITELHLKDYKPPTHLIRKTDLIFELNSEEDVLITSKLQLKRNPLSLEPASSIYLDGAPEEAPPGSETPTLHLLEAKINGKALSPDEYTRTHDGLTIQNLPSDEFILELKTRINPKANKALSGLYTSGGKFITQCESEGFRNITFYMDRPDVLSEFTTTIIAEKGKYPALLSNGNPSPKSMTPDGRETITWHNPYPKPSYLFALVAGDFGMISDQFNTQSGRTVHLQIFVDHGDEAKAQHALNALQKFLKWDEENYGREYDLDLYQVVVTNDFNFGAMENKGLNIFNASAALADPKTATDARYGVVQDVIAHEATHNWRGNRVTIKNWFQVCLKEGLTTFTEQEFSTDMTAPTPAVKRIEDVIGMRSAQFPEDASAMAHPIRPSSVGSIENFYTPTVYEKGSEVIRMIKTLVGPEHFRKAMDLYFARYDGQAITTEDFIQVFEEISGIDLSQFERTWYNQAGTPTLSITDRYEPEKQEYRLTIRQSTPATPGQLTKEPFHIPIRVGLIDQQGNDMPLQIDPSQAKCLSNGDVLNLQQTETTFVFKNVKEKPVPSLLRNWSAPVKLNYKYSRQQLGFLMMHDSDGFNRWEAGQALAVDVLKELVSAYRSGASAEVDAQLIESYGKILADRTLNPALAAMTIQLPTTSYLAELYPDGQVDIDAIHYAVKQTGEAIGKALESILLLRFNENRSSETRPYSWNKQDVAERALKNMSLSYLVKGNPEKYLPFAITQFDQNHNMTDVRSALRIILDHATPEIYQAKLDAFYQEHQNNPLAMNLWLTDQAQADRPEVLSQVNSLLRHPCYHAKNPNAVRTLIGGFASNLVHFHQKDGAGYQFLAEQIISTDKFNPSLAAGLSKRLATPHRFDRHRQALIKNQLENIQANTLSNPVQEIVSKTLAVLSEQST